MYILKHCAVCDYPVFVIKAKWRNSAFHLCVPPCGGSRVSHMRTRPSSEELAKTLSLTGLTDRPYTASSCKKTFSVSPRSTSCRITCSSFPAATDRNVTHLIFPPFQLQYHESEQLLVLPPEKTRLLVLSNARQKMLDRCSPFNLIGLARECIAFSMCHSNTLRSSPPKTEDILINSPE